MINVCVFLFKYFLQKINTNIKSKPYRRCMCIGIVHSAYDYLIGAVSADSRLIFISNNISFFPFQHTVRL